MRLLVPVTAVYRVYSFVSRASTAYTRMLLRNHAVPTSSALGGASQLLECTRETKKCDVYLIMSFVRWCASQVADMNIRSPNGQERR